MNKKQRENTAKMFYDLVKVPLAACCFGAIVSEHTDMITFIFFGASFALLFYYLGFLTDIDE
ncbi:hypothetical protein [Endozoicomonas sp. Mp262]|uniref:hypothetical protein n=1 Tax=Endozoicomonas sp. Mp262 TaxID=2919499 RepID=UPI0021D7EA96